MLNRVNTTTEKIEEKVLEHTYVHAAESASKYVAGTHPCLSFSLLTIHQPKGKRETHQACEEPNRPFAPVNCIRKHINPTLEET
jgi:hypothetical protein